MSCPIPEKLLVEKNDIIICARNGSRKLVGKSAIIKELHEPMTFGAFMAICKTPLYKYVSIYLQTPLFFSQLREDNETTTICQLTQSRFNNFLIPIPPFPEQYKICNRMDDLSRVLNLYEETFDKLSTLNDNLRNSIKKSILQEAIQGRLVPQIESEGTAEHLLAEIREEKIRLVKEGKLKKSALAGESRIFRGDDNKYYEQIGARTVDIDDQIPFDTPDSWRWIRLGHIIDFSSNNSSKAENIPSDVWILDLEDIEKNTGNLLRRKRMSEINAKSDKHYFSAGNILYSKLRPYLNKVLIADKDGYCTSEILVFDFGRINAEFALTYLRSPFFVEYAMSDAYGVKMPRLGSKQGNNALMPIPPLPEQKRIVDRIKQLKCHLV